MLDNKFLNAIMYTVVGVGIAVSASVMGVAVLGLVIILIR